MSRFSSILASAALAGAVQLVSGLAAAHIHLLAPVPRYPDAVAGENKNCPCGVGTAGRTCSDPAERSDDHRSSDRATALPGGSLLTVRISEYVGHAGRLRVAFDPDGADVADFNQHILADIADPAGKMGNTGNGTVWEIAAQLPNIDCQNCTLQVVQVMNGNTQEPVADTVGQSTYYQCADLTLIRDASQPEGYSLPFIGPGLPLESTDAVVDMPDSGSLMPVAPADAPAAADSDRLARDGVAQNDAASESGCNMASHRGATTLPELLLAAMALFAVRGRRGRQRLR